MSPRSAGIDTEKYSGHSLRRGGATHAMRCEAQSDWKSNAYERYLDNAFSDRFKAVSIAAKHVSNDQTSIFISLQFRHHTSWGV